MDQEVRVRASGLSSSPASSIPSKLYLSTLQILLIEKALTWPETTTPVAMIFAKDEPTQADVDTFQKLFVVEFPLHPDGRNDPAFGKEIDSFLQSPNESIFQYYTRAG